MKQMFTAVGLMLALPVPLAAQSNAWFGDAFLQSVYSNAVMAHPNHGTSVTIREDQAASQYAAYTSADGLGNIVIEVFTINIKGSMTELELSSLSDGVWKGALFPLLAHESYHACRQSWGLYASKCHDEDSSCEHLAIETAAAGDDIIPDCLDGEGESYCE